MPVIEAIVLGIVQGLSEFLPISSSGHLVLTRWAFGWDELDGDIEQSFDVAVHIGTLVGVVVYFHRDIATYIAAGWRALVRRREPIDTDGRVAWLLVVSMIPAVVTGLALESVLQTERIWLIAVMLILFGLVLYWADRLRGDRAVGEFSLRDALLMGAGQALALQPGVSRSGVTMTVGRVLHFDRASAARIAFLMSLPVIAGAGVYKALSVQMTSDLYAPFASGMVAAALTGYLAVWGTMKLVQSHTFAPFVVYRVLLGVAVLVALATGVR